MKICIERSDRMGDMILTLPMIKGIKEKNPNVIIDVVASKKNLRICKLSKLINKTYEKTNNYLTFKELTNSIRKEQYDYYFAFSPSWFGLLLGYYSQSKLKSALILQSRYKSNFLSKFWQIIFTKIFFSQSKVVNRFKSLRENQNIHQTKMMMDVIINSGIKLNKNNKSDFTFTNTFTFKKDKKVCVIHLSSKWINKYYEEDNFLELLKALEKKNLGIYLTSDETSKSKFDKIFTLYSSTDKSSDLINNDKQILLCNNFDFKNWTTLLNQADYTITPESGCTHIASLTSAKLCVIYDADNSPKSIMCEYAPWNKDYLALETNDLDLNKKLLNFIE
tara:strand:+ start:696 stop:1700 length:1005 start_codon:yes stop_codon:yes gene_type:complete